MTKRIRWEPTKYGGWTGHVGTAGDFLFQVWLADTAAGGWQLDSTLPGQFGSGWHRCDTDPEKLKADAEEWLERFVSSLGAVFGDAVAVGLRSRADEMDATVAHDTGHERDKQLFGAGLRRAADLLEHGDQPAVHPEPVPPHPEEEAGR